MWGLGIAGKEIFPKHSNREYLQEAELRFFREARVWPQINGVDLAGAGKGPEPISDARDSDSKARSHRILPRRDRKGALTRSPFSAQSTSRVGVD